MFAQLPVDTRLSGPGFLWFSLIWLVTTVFWLWTLRDCLTAGRTARREKLLWVIVLLATYVFGAVLYFLLVQIRRGRGKLPPAGP